MATSFVSNCFAGVPHVLRRQPFPGAEPRAIGTWGADEVRLIAETSNKPWVWVRVEGPRGDFGAWAWGGCWAAGQSQGLPSLRDKGLVVFYELRQNLVMLRQTWVLDMRHATCAASETSGPTASDRL